MRFGLKSLLVRTVISWSAFTIALPEMAFADVKDHWENTGLNDSHLKRFISQEKCYSNETSFLGCIDAINSLLASGYPKKILTNQNIQTMPSMGKSISDIEGLKIQTYEPQTDGLTSSEIIQKNTNENKIITQSWKTFYAFAKNNPVSIQKIIDKSLSLTSNRYRAAKLANAINEYYKTAIDPHTYIIPASERKEKQSSSESQVVGIGVQILQKQKTTILIPKASSPALAAGIMPMDVLLEIDNASVSGASVNDIKNLITGAENTPVKITVQRNGQKFNFEILRAKYTESNIELQMMNDPVDRSKIGYIKINSFQEKGICQKFYYGAIALRNRGAKSLVLDLRNNLGGLVSEGSCVASTYLEKGQIVFTENDPATNAVKTVYKDVNTAHIYDLYNKKPLIILMNASSASASEMVAGALRAYKRSIIIGDRSYGKGTSQSEHSWQELGKEELKGITIMKTTARFHFSNKESNQLVGLIPDIEVQARANPTEEDLFAVREADAYSNAVSAAPFAPYVPRTQIRTVSRCMESRNMMDSDYAQRLNSHLAPDYQMSAAREAASCL